MITVKVWTPFVIAAIFFLLGYVIARVGQRRPSELDRKTLKIYSAQKNLGGRIKNTLVKMHPDIEIVGDEAMEDEGRVYRITLLVGGKYWYIDLNLMLGHYTMHRVHRYKLSQDDPSEALREVVHSTRLFLARWRLS